MNRALASGSLAFLALTACADFGFRVPVYPAAVGSTGGQGASRAAICFGFPQKSRNSNADTLSAGSLRVLAARMGHLIGSATNSNAFQSDPAYREILGREFNSLTPETALKFGSVEPARGHFDFSAMDSMAAFARQHGMVVHGHTLVWAQQIPKWILSRAIPRQEKRNLLHEYINRVVQRYSNQIHSWDVVNEPLDSSGRLAPSFWRDVLGDNYIAIVLEWVHEQDPDASLYINEFDALGDTAKQRGLYALVRDLKRLGAPIHGVGFQEHIDLNNDHAVEHKHGPIPCFAQVKKTMGLFERIGVVARVSEMDVEIVGSRTDSVHGRQAQIFRMMMAACMSASNCEGLTTWGFTDAYSWLAVRDHVKTSDGLLFDRNLRPKVALFGLASAFVSCCVHRT